MLRDLASFVLAAVNDEEFSRAADEEADAHYARQDETTQLPRRKSTRPA